MNTNETKLEVIHGNYFTDYGFTALSNLILDYQEELKISDTELLFIIKVWRYTKNYTIKNSNIGYCDKTIQRVRKSLKEKNFLSYTIIQGKNSDGTFFTEGCRYDFSGLDDVLSNLYKKIKENNDTSTGRNIFPSGEKVFPLAEERNSEYNNINYNTNNNTTTEEVVKSPEGLSFPAVREPKSVYNKTINNTTSEEVENIKNKLLDDFNNEDSQLSKEMYYADYKETTGTVHSSVRNVIDSLNKKSLVSQFLKMDLYSSEGQKIAPLSLLGVLGDYLVSCFEDTDGFIRKNEKLPFNDIGIFIYNNRRLEDLISFYQKKNGFPAATA